MIWIDKISEMLKEWISEKKTGTLIFEFNFNQGFMTSVKQHCVTIEKSNN